MCCRVPFGVVQNIVAVDLACKPWNYALSTDHCKKPKNKLIYLLIKTNELMWEAYLKANKVSRFI